MFSKSVNIIYVLCYFYEAREPFKKNLSGYNYCIVAGILALDTLGQFQFQNFQLNKIIGFFFGCFMRKHLFVSNIRPTETHFYTLLPSKICSKPAGNENEKVES